MAKVHNLPPQAYTRDVLVKAIDWVATQSPTMRERASSADALVSLYLQARRRASDWHNEAPVSGENFRADLKNLAEDLKQFEEPSVPPQVNHVPHVHTQQEYRHETYAPAPPLPPPPKAAPSVQGWVIDPRSLSAAKEIQARLNFGSETEAIRFLVTLGIERARQMFP
jgi:hypothetical protein